MLYVTYKFFSVYFPDPSNINRLYFQPLQKDIKSHKENIGALNNSSCFEKIFRGEGVYDKVFVYIFDAAVVKNTPWDIIARDYLVLKRYDLTLEDLQRLDWKISYPPTEAMKDVEQWPPYGSE